MTKSLAEWCGGVGRHSGASGNQSAFRLALFCYIRRSRQMSAR